MSFNSEQLAVAVEISMQKVSFPTEQNVAPVQKTLQHGSLATLLTSEELVVTRPVVEPLVWREVSQALSLSSRTFTEGKSKRAALEGERAVGRSDMRSQHRSGASTHTHIQTHTHTPYFV